MGKLLRASAGSGDRLRLDPLAYLLGLEGVALMRAFAGEYDEDFVERRLAEVSSLLERRDDLGAPRELRRLDVDEGYDVWSLTYDDPGNGLLEVDARVVTSMLADHEPGLAVDAACGTGRHSERLAERGYTVIGVDSSEGMLAAARQKVPRGDFRAGDLRNLPVDSGAADLVMCTLALTHLESITDAYLELARVAKPGARVVVSDAVPFYLDSTCFPLVKQFPDGTYGYIPGYRHTVTEHITAAFHAGLLLTRLEEVTHHQIVDPSAEPEDVTELPYPNPWALQTLVPTATNAAYEGQPFAMFFQFEKNANGANPHPGPVR